MPIGTPTFRLFVSSTFEDLKAERSALQCSVFPKLQTLCEQHGARFQAIDLRWGVRDEAGLDQQTMEICLREIRRCQATGVQPNFIVLLGDRYGWQPLPPRILASEFDPLRPHIPAGDAPGLADQWYQLDENAVPPEYCLQPRTSEFVDLDVWKPLEQTLRQALAQAARAAGLAETELIKYEASATHQEILAGLGQTDAELLHVFGFFRRPGDEAGMETDARLEDLKSYLRGRLPGNIVEFNQGDTAALCNDVYARLRQVIDSEVKHIDVCGLGEGMKGGSSASTSSYRNPHIPPALMLVSAASQKDVRYGSFASWMVRRISSGVKHLCSPLTTGGRRKPSEDRTALDREVEAHDRFAEDRCRIFTGRKIVLNAIADYVRGEDRRPLVLHGESGSGKSAVMATASQRYQGPGRMIRRFIGASPQSASGHALLTSLCWQIAPGETPVDYAQLENTFGERLKVATPEQPLVLFIDALDQLAASDPARDVSWLPPELPPHVKVIISIASAEDGEPLPEGLPVRLEHMTQSEAGQALDEFFREARRTLQPWQRETVLAHFERCGLPLYLKLAAEESRLWKSYASEDACTLGEGVAGVIDTLLDRLSSNANHGPVLVRRSLGYLAAARYGLAEGEVLDLLNADTTVWSDFDQRKHHEVRDHRLPVVVWSRLSLDLEPYLTERAAPGGTVMAFYHRQLAESVASRFLVGAELQARHRDMARYFGTKTAWLDEGRNAPNPRRAVELVFQQRGAQQWADAEATLFDSEFLLAKCAVGMVLDLDADYQVLLQEAPESVLPRREAMRLIHGALRLSTHVLAQDSTQFTSQMVGRLLAHYRGQHTIARFVDEITAAAPRPWLRPLHPCLVPPGSALLRTLTGHSVLEGAPTMSAVALSADGSRVVSASEDWTLKVWDSETGRELRTLVGHSQPVYDVAISADRRRIVSASRDWTLKVWDLETGRELRTLVGHSWPVYSVALSADGLRAVSASADKTLKVWDLETGRELRTLVGHVKPVYDVAVSADGRRAVSASEDNTLKVWDLETGSELRSLAARCWAVRAVAVTADGQRVVSASDDGARFDSTSDATLKVWDLESGRALRTLTGHSGRVFGVTVSADGRRAVTASSDRTLKVWDLETGREPQTLAGHCDIVSGVGMSADGCRAVSASPDGTVKVWDLETLRQGHNVASHTDVVSGVAVSGGGRRAVSASRDCTLKVWDLETGLNLRTLRGHSKTVMGVAVTGDGRRAVSASMDCTLKVWDPETGSFLRTLARHFGPGHSEPEPDLAVAVSRDGRRVVSGSWDQTLTVWDLESGRELHTLFGHSGSVRGVAVTADGRRAVSASADKTLKVWDLETGRELRTLSGHSEEVLSVAVSADDRRTISASADATLKVWDLKNGREIRTLTGHSDQVAGVAVGADGQRAVSASCDRTLKVWNVETGAVIATFRCDGAACCCSFTGDDKIVAGDASGRVYFLSLELNEEN